MTLAANPYDWQRVNPSLFYGRKELADDLCTRLINGHSFGIVGGRKIGKTTLLRYVEKELLRRSNEAIKGDFLVIPVYIDVLTFPPRSEVEHIYQQIATLIQKQLEQVKELKFIPTSQIDCADNFREYLSLLVNSINDYRIQIIFLFDEVEPIIASAWGHGFFTYWRSLLSNSTVQSYISATFAGANEIDEIKRDVTSPLANILAWIELRLFHLNDSAELVREPSQYNWPESFIVEIHNVTGGHPFLIQYMMQYICAHDVKMAANSLEEAQRRFLTEQKVQFQNWWERFHDNTTRAIYAHLAEKDVLSQKAILLTFGGDAKRGIDVLAHTGVVRFEELTETVSIAGSLFREWFKHYGTIEVTPTLEDQVDTSLKKVEKLLRQLLVNHFNNKYNSGWLQKHFQSGKSEKWKKVLQDAKKTADTNLNNEEVLQYIHFADCFDLLLLGPEWGDLGNKFRNLSSDRNKRKTRIEERKDHLVYARNEIAHRRPLSLGNLLKAQAFCIDLLDALQ